MERHTIQEKLNRSFRTFKDCAAIKYGNQVLTYDELEKRSNSAASWIAKRGIKKESFIGIMLNSRKEFIVVIIGILKARCVFVPLDTAYPDKRLVEMIQFTNIRFVIGDPPNILRLKGCDDLKTHALELIDVNDLNPRKERERDGYCYHVTQAPIRYSGEDKVYIYFTSGTTGTPKAIIGKNKGLLHFINWEIKTFAVNEMFRFSQFTNPGFDVYLRDIFVPLCAGGTVCIPENKNIIINRAQLVKWIDHNCINLIHCVPSLFRLLNTHDLQPKYFKSLKYLLFAGEKVIPKELVNWYEIFGERIQLVNLYGPTETTLAKVFYLIQPSDTNREIMPIGKHIKGARVIILNQNMAICRPLEAGELYIRTPYRTYGYCNEPQLNTEKFIPNPFNNDPDDILYKTGDLGRFLLDGNIELLGRIDRQVKIRGMRVELDEIENTLLKHPSVKEAVVIKQEVTESNVFLVALVTRIEESGQNIPQNKGLISHLNQYLLEKLPDYMVPTRLTMVERLPRKTNGKMDYDEIMEIVKNISIDHTPSKNDIEEKLVKIWSELLGFETIGIRNSFFDLGGNSLSVISLTNRINKEFNVIISLRKIFVNDTIEKQAEIISKTKRDVHLSIEISEKKEYYPLSSAQKRLFILNRIEDENAVTYNLPQTALIKSKIDQLHLENVFKSLITRHESLRTSYVMLEQNPVQIVHDSADFKIKYGECDEKEAKERIKKFVKPFDLSQAPLLRVELVKIDVAQYILMVDMHHIIADGKSLQILLKEFTLLYEGETPPPLRIHYKDFAEWQNRLFEPGMIKEQEEYWLNRFRGEIPVLDLPTDYPRPPIRSVEGKTIFLQLNKELIDKMKKMNLEMGTTLYILLLAVYNVLLSKYSFLEEIIVGTPIVGRRHVDLQKIIGSFANMLAMRNFPKANNTFINFLMEVKENTLNAYENQDYQFEELIAKLDLPPDPSMNPLFDTVFNFFSIEKENETPQAIDDFKVDPYDSERNSSKYDLLLRGVEGENTVIMSLEYSTALFKSGTVENMMNHFIEILEQVVENKELLLKDITISHNDFLLVKSTAKEEDVGFNF